MEKTSNIQLDDSDGLVIKVTLYNEQGDKSYLESVRYETVDDILKQLVDNNLQWKVTYTWTKEI